MLATEEVRVECSEAPGMQEWCQSFIYGDEGLRKEEGGGKKIEEKGQISTTLK